MMIEQSDEGRSLYRFSYYEPEDDCNYVDWVWLKSEEVLNYRPDSLSLEYRPATKDETELYEEAYADGYGVAAILEFESSYDGVTFRVEIDEDGELDMNGAKMFQCGICDKHKDFDDEVAMTAGLFLGEVKDDKLWHVCYSCAENAAMIQGIEDSMEES